MIIDFQDKQSLTQKLLVKAMTKGVTAKGSPYLSITFQDASGTIDGKLWDVKPEQEATIKQGFVEDVNFDVIEYNKTLQLKVHSITMIDQASIDLSDYVIASKVPMEELHSRISDAISSIKNENYRKLIETIYAQAGEAFYQYPAAAKIHHSFLGGLATHVTGMVALANEICKLYPQLDRDLLISGILVHDVGKMIELSGPIVTEYTLEGKLIGHISIIQGKLMEAADQLKIGDSEEAILLRHMVLSHHGHYEYGSPVLPMLQEAEVLYLIDNLDARLNTLDAALNQVQPGQFTSKLFALEGRSFYKPKTK